MSIEKAQRQTKHMKEWYPYTDTDEAQAHYARAAIDKIDSLLAQRPDLAKTVGRTQERVVLFQTMGNELIQC